MQVAFLTVGDTSRRTGGYLYHARLFEGLRSQGIVVREIVASMGVSPDAQQVGSARLADRLGEIVAADVIVVDALARLACAPWIERWQAVRPLVTLVHELPSVANGIAVSGDEREAEARILAADALISVSGHGRSILEARGIETGRIAVVSPGCDRVVPHETGVRQAEPPLVLCVAQWIPRKGIDTLVQAWNMLGPRKATLELIGETDADEEYAATVRALIAAGHGDVIVSGAVDDAHLERSYAAASVFALPSRYEGYGMVYAEALLHGLPVVACNVGPVPEMVGEQAGVLVPPDDPSALAEALDRLLAEPGARERLARGARQRSQELPTWDDTVAGVRDVLEAVIAQRAAAT